MTGAAKGPWAVFEFGGTIGDDFGGKGICQSGKSLEILMGDPSAFVASIIEECPNADANAHLIAAVPELRDADEMALDYLENHHGNEAAHRLVVMALKAALAKSRGEE